MNLISTFFLELASDIKTLKEKEPRFNFMSLCKLLMARLDQQP